MMKQIATITSLLVAATLMSACSKHATPETPKAAPAAAAPAQEAPRPATYDPNLKPAEIVWDSPEKKAEWEAHQARIQAELQAANQAAAAGQAPSAQQALAAQQAQAAQPAQAAQAPAAPAPVPTH